MASSEGDFLFEDDFDAVLAIIDADILENDQELDSEIAVLTSTIPSEESPVYKCAFCTKTCLSKGGLTRHMRSKHKDKADDTTNPTQSLKPKLGVTELKHFYTKSVEKLAKDECYPIDVTDQFQKCGASTMEDLMPVYELIIPIVNSFSGDTEKFYPKMYQVLSTAENYRNLDHNCTLLLNFEVINLVLAHLTGGTFHEDVFTLEDTSWKNLSGKEISIISYLSGYVFGTFYRRIRFSKSGRCGGSFYHQQCLSFLMAGKSGENTLPQDKHIDLLDRGGLWKVTPAVTSIFSVAEGYFKCATQKSTAKIDVPKIISSLMTNPTVLSNFSIIRSSSLDPIKKEIALNLLEDLLTLYIRVRSFSYAKDQCQAFKIRQAKLKSKSLRTSLKRSAFMEH